MMTCASAFRRQHFDKASRNRATRHEGRATTDPTGGLTSVPPDAEHLFTDADGRTWGVSREPPDEGLSGTANLGPEDLIFESGAEQRVVRGFGLGQGVTPFDKLSDGEIAGLFLHATPTSRKRSTIIRLEGADWECQPTRGQARTKAIRAPIDDDRDLAQVKCVRSDGESVYLWFPRDWETRPDGELTHLLEAKLAKDRKSP